MRATRWLLAGALALGCGHARSLADLVAPVVKLEIAAVDQGRFSLAVRVMESAPSTDHPCPDLGGDLRVSVDGKPLAVTASGRGRRWSWFARLGTGSGCDPLFVTGEIAASSAAVSRVEIIGDGKTISLEVANLTRPRTVAIDGPLVPGTRASVSWLPATDQFELPGSAVNPHGPDLCVDFVYDEQPQRAPDTRPRGFRRYVVDDEKIVRDGKVTYVNRSDARVEGNRISFTVPSGAAPGKGRLFVQPCDVSHAEVFPKVVSCRGASRCWATYALAWKEPGPYDGVTPAEVVAPRRR